MPFLARPERATIEAYRGASPFPHIVADGRFPRSLMQAVSAELPETSDVRGCATRATRCFAHEGKSQITDRSQMGNATQLLLDTLSSDPFIKHLEALTGISGLIADARLFGSGVHLTRRGGLLAIHADFNHLPRKAVWHRRVNCFVYLNNDWPEEYGGHLELWDRNLSACTQRILPTMGRLVAFSTSDFSYHGHPVPLSAPAGRMRRSVAMYYYSHGTRPAQDCLQGDCYSMHSTLFKKTDSSNCMSHHQSQISSAPGLTPPMLPGKAEAWTLRNSEASLATLPTAKQLSKLGTQVAMLTSKVTELQARNREIMHLLRQLPSHSAGQLQGGPAGMHD